MCFALLVPGCAKVPQGREAITKVQITGLPNGSRERFKAGIATQETPQFLGTVPWFLEYKVFDQSALEVDLTRIARELRRMGYYEAHVYAARIIKVTDEKVRVEIAVDLGEAVFVTRLETSGLSNIELTPEADRAVARARVLEPKSQFSEEKLNQSKQQIVKTLADFGYAYAKAEGKAEVDIGTHSATVRLSIKPGLRATLGDVRIIGCRSIPEAKVRSTLLLRKGETYSNRQLALARSAVFQTGAFAKVEIKPDLSDPTRRAIPIDVIVEESALRSVNAGGGVTFDVLRFSINGKVGWTHRNFLGGMRKFTITAQPGITLFPTRFEQGFFVAPSRVLPENALTLRLEQPAFLEGRTKGIFETGYNIYPLLLPLNPEAIPQEERIIGYNELTLRPGAERFFFGRKFLINLSLNWRMNQPFTYQGSLEDNPGLAEGLKRVIVTYPTLITQLDFRDDPLQPKRGVLLSNNLQVAVPVLGSDIFDIRIQPTIATFFPLDRRRKLIFATRFTLGMILAPNYGSALSETGATIDYNDPAIVEDQHKLLFRAFYSGGPNSNRGYPYRVIGPQGPISFLIPNGATCDQSNPATSDPSCIRPLGGFSLWEASVELRYQFDSPWGVILFADTSDVSVKPLTFHFNRPHLSVGPGLRYASPIGPVRLDFGYRVPGLQQLQKASDEPPDVSEVPPYEPSSVGYRNDFRQWAVNILIGEAF